TALDVLLASGEVGVEVQTYRAQIVSLGCDLDRRAQVVELAADVVERAFEDVAVHRLRESEVADRIRQLDLAADAGWRRAQRVEDLRRENVPADRTEVRRRYVDARRLHDGDPPHDRRVDRL